MLSLITGLFYHNPVVVNFGFGDKQLFSKFSLATSPYK
jgi:hypothetical protein